MVLFYRRESHISFFKLAIARRIWATTTTSISSSDSFTFLPQTPNTWYPTIRRPSAPDSDFIVYSNTTTHRRWTRPSDFEQTATGHPPVELTINTSRRDRAFLILRSFAAVRAEVGEKLALA